MPDFNDVEIRSLRLFSEMQRDNFDAIMRAAYVQNFPAQIDLITEGEPPDFLHVVVSGSVDLFASWNGRETSMAAVGPVSTFILAASIRDAPYLMSARTIEKSRIVLIPSQNIRDVFERDAQFAKAMVVELAQCYRSVVKASKDLKLRTSRERLANYLLRQHKRGNGLASFQLPTGKRRLASFLGMTPENLSRGFKALQSHGVSVSGNEVVIDDLAALEELAKPHPLIDDYSM